MAADTAHDIDLVTVNMAKKRVYLRFRGSLTKAQAENLREAYRSAIAQVGSGYTAVSIFEDFMPGTAEVQEIISSMILMADEGGCRAAARVGQGGVFGQMQLGRLQREVQAGYSVHDCETLPEADTYLDAV
ncbi:MAG: hypothetical protein IFK93_16555 [Acidobacteria bacterium]|nr:hypothetical protein [Candidatus Sulfomarinibacter kjeldsenii]